MEIVEIMQCMGGRRKCRKKETHWYNRDNGEGMRVGVCVCVCVEIPTFVVPSAACY